MLSVSVKSKAPKVKKKLVDAAYAQEEKQDKLSVKDLPRWGPVPVLWP